MPETIRELVRKQKEQQTKREITEDTVMTETSATQKQDNSEVEEVSSNSCSIIPNPLTPPTSDLTKDKTQVKLEAPPVSSCGMMDRTRVALFAFMFTFLFINPLSYVFPQLDKGTTLFSLLEGSIAIKKFCRPLHSLPHFDLVFSAKNLIFNP